MTRGRGNQRPNVLVFLSHDIGLTYGCYGHPYAQTPCVDRLSRDGVVFDNHYCHYPLCGPSRANMFTGLEPAATRRFDNRPFFDSFRSSDNSDRRTLPEHFSECGYTTRAFGLVYHDAIDAPSWSDGHTCYPENSLPSDESFGVPVGLLAGWRDGASKETIRRRCEVFVRQGVPIESLTELPYRRRVRGPAVEAADVSDDAYHDGEVSRDAATWIETRDRESPFFLVCGFVSAHTPFRAPRVYWDRYDRSRLRLPKNGFPPCGSPTWAEGDSEPAQYYTQHDYERPWRANREHSLELLHGHLATVSYIDTQIARVMHALERSGQREETFIVVVSDHGFSDGHHGYWGKHNLWDRSLRAPLIIRVPDRLSVVARRASVKARVKALSAHVDLFPTLCELCGLDVPESLNGDSLVPAMTGKAVHLRDSVISVRRPLPFDRQQVYAEAISVRTSRFRLTRYLDGNRGVLASELFDYEIDPEESKNLSGDPGYRDVEALIGDPLSRAAI